MFAFTVNIFLQLDGLSATSKIVEFRKSVRDLEFVAPVDLMAGNNDLERKWIYWIAALRKFLKKLYKITSNTLCVYFVFRNEFDLGFS
jgi:hypothetical protein